MMQARRIREFMGAAGMILGLLFLLHMLGRYRHELPPQQGVPYASSPLFNVSTTEPPEGDRP